MARAGADVAEAELVQDLAHCALVIGHTEALGDEALEVNAPPDPFEPSFDVIRPDGTIETRRGGR